MSEDGADRGVLSAEEAVSVDDWLFSRDGSLQNNMELVSRKQHGVSLKKTTWS